MKRRFQIDHPFPPGHHLHNKADEKLSRFDTLGEAVAVAAWRMGFDGDYSRERPPLVTDRATGRHVGAAELVAACITLAEKQPADLTIPTFVLDGETHMGIRA